MSFIEEKKIPLLQHIQKNTYQRILSRQQYRCREVEYCQSKKPIQIKKKEKNHFLLEVQQQTQEKSVRYIPRNNHISHCELRTEIHIHNSSIPLLCLSHIPTSPL